MAPADLKAAFVAALDGRLEPPPDEPSDTRSAFDLEERLSKLVERARAAWPSLAIRPETYVAYIAERISGPTLAGALEQIRAEDLYLACACAHGSAEALMLFEQTYFPEIERAVVNDPKASIEDLKQILRQRLFVAVDGRPPKICEYAARGELRNWFRITVVRTALNLRNRGPKEILVKDSEIDALPLLATDPELSFMKELYRDEFRRALTAASHALAPRERNLLRYSTLEGLYVDQIAAIYGVHASTMARWLAGAREALLDHLRREMMAHLRIDRGEFESLLRLIRSQLDITLERVLGGGPQ